jgi:hypothetical protein
MYAGCHAQEIGLRWRSIRFSGANFGQIDDNAELRFPATCS